MRELWALAERIIPRGATALILILLATQQSPSGVGAFSAAVIVLTLVQSFTDVAGRQVAILHAGTVESHAFMRRFQASAAPIGFVLMAGFLVFAGDAGFAGVDPWALAPLALVPVVTAVELVPVVRLQASGAWRDVATAQAIACLVSVLVCAPIVWFTGSLVGASLHLVLSETIFCILVFVSVRRGGHDRTEPVPATTRLRIWHEYWATAVYAALGWGQTQADRAAVGIVAGPASLGLYAMANQVGRSLGEAASAGSANVLRADIGQFRDQGEVELRRRAGQSLLRTSGILVGLFVVTVTLTETVLRWILAASWDPALDAVPVLAGSVIATAVAWTATATLQAQARVRLAFGPRVVGVALALPIAFAATSSIELAALIALGRELLVATLLMIAARRGAPWRVVYAAFATMLGLVAASLIFLPH